MYIEASGQKLVNKTLFTVNYYPINCNYETFGIQLLTK